MRRLKLLILTLAAWSRREEVTRAINSSAWRPLVFQPDWFLGWVLLMYQGDHRPGAVRLYRAAVRERSLRYQNVRSATITAGVISTNRGDGNGGE